MAADDNTFESITIGKSDGKGKSKLLSPDPVRKKYVTELLHAFATRQISFADLTRLPQKKIQQVSEMGYVKLRHGRYEEARKIFEVLTFLDHKNFFHHLALGSAYQKLKRFIDAAFQYSEVLKFSPGNTNALVNRGEVFLRNKNYRRAAEDFREAILADNVGKDRYANRARSLVVAIKRSLERDKELKAKIARGELPAERKKISPLSMIKTSASTDPTPHKPKK